ncbi:MAG: hypothetical protein WBC53_01505 [Phycisphaerae bacterium]
MRRDAAIHILSVAATVLGVMLVSGDFWSDVLDPLIFDSSGHYRTGIVLGTLSRVLLQISRVLNFGWFYGTPLLLLGLTGLCHILTRSRLLPGWVRTRPKCGAALGVVASANALVLLFSVQFFFVPEGAYIRPMGWACFMFVVSICTLGVAGTLGIIAIVRERPRIAGAVCLVLALTPLFFSWLILLSAMWLKGFYLSD